MGKRKKEQPQPEIRYSWQIWCAVAGVIAAVALVLVMGFLSIKAMVQNVQILTYEIRQRARLQLQNTRGNGLSIAIWNHRLDTVFSKRSTM